MDQATAQARLPLVRAAIDRELARDAVSTSGFGRSTAYAQRLDQLRRQEAELEAIIANAASGGTTRVARFVDEREITS
jgi:predicted butyrate kinase (DUF1464 family)